MYKSNNSWCSDVVYIRTVSNMFHFVMFLKDEVFQVKFKPRRTLLLQSGDDFI